MKVTFAGAHAGVRAAVERSNELLCDPLFFQRIAEHPGFDMSTATPAQISSIMQKSPAVVAVTLYQSRWPWSKALAFEDSRFPDKIFLNSRRLERSLASLCDTFIHECVHALDATEEGLRFGHGDNSPNNKENTAPWWIGDLAHEFVEGSSSAFMPLFADMDSEWSR